MGLRLNLTKSAFLIKRGWSDAHQETLQSFKIEIKERVKYAGILLGHVSSEEARAPIIARASTKANFMSDLQLTLDERIATFLEMGPAAFHLPCQGLLRCAHGGSQIGDTIQGKVST